MNVADHRDTASWLDGRPAPTAAVGNPDWRGLVYRVEGDVIANLESAHADRFLHLKGCMTFKDVDWDASDHHWWVAVPDAEVAALWLATIASDRQAIGLSRPWPDGSEQRVGWCPHCIVRQISPHGSGTPRRRRMPPPPPPPPCGLEMLHAAGLCDCDDDA